MTKRFGYSLIFFFLVFNFVAKGQSITFLNGYKHPIKNPADFPPSYFSSEIIIGDTVFTKVLSMDSTLVSESIKLKGVNGEVLKETSRSFGPNGIMEWYTEKDLISGTTGIETFHKDGSIKSKTLQKGDAILEEEYFDEEGVVRPKPLQVDPSPKGGLQGWNQYLSQNMKYPKEARKNNYQGTVYLAFVISEDGSIQDLDVINPEDNHPLLTQEALRIVKSYPYKWSPGLLDGIAVRVLMTLPIRFRFS
jgi:TonB family protein